MKRSVLIFVTTILISALTSFQLATGQQKSKEEKEREFRMQEEIDAQKRAIAEQKKQQETELKELQEHQKEFEKVMKDAQTRLKSPGRFKYFDFEEGKPIPFGWESLDNLDDPLVIAQGIDPFLGRFLGPDIEKSTWVFSKSIKDKTFSSEYTFDVEPSTNTVVMSVNGDCKSGEIRINIAMPNGKTYSDIAIDEFGHLNWRKSFTMSEEENQDKAGAWKFQINAKKASGYFKISLQTY